MIEGLTLTQNNRSKISIVLCSRNRSKQVSHCLARLDLLELAALKGELVLVDSASNDNTSEVFNSFQAQHPESRVQVCTVEEKGLSIARNIGVRCAHANLIIFLDDDVYLEKGHLTQIIDLFEKQNSRVGVAGGRILRFDPEDSLYCCQLSERYRIYRAGSTVRPGALQGSNFAIRRATFEAIGGFDEMLGAGQKYRCEDIDFIARALQAGWEAVYDPALIVYHHHGRRDGDDVEALRHDNSYASGAFFSKMLKQGYGEYWYMLALYVLSTPVRPNMKLISFFNGWRDYRYDYSKV
jgi:GT2 family glycosyltransferase